MRISDWSSDVCSSDLGSASTVIDGTVDGNVSLTSTATNNAYDYASPPTGYTYSDTNVGAGGAATGDVGATGAVDGNFTATGDNNLLLNNSGDTIRTSYRPQPRLTTHSPEQLGRIQNT